MKWIEWTGKENVVPYKLYLLQTEDTTERNGNAPAVIVGYAKEFSYTTRTRYIHHKDKLFYAFPQ